MKRRVADIIVETLVECGVDDCFCVVGGGAMFLDNALALNKEIKTYFNHHEQACAIAAEAYARIKERPALVCATSGPGAVNAMNGVVGAYVDSIPMVVITGNVRTDISVASSGLPLRYRGVQEFDVIPAVKGFTKYAVTIWDPKDAKAIVKKAYAAAMHGRRGPVWIDVPLDIQSALVDKDELNEIKGEQTCLVPDEADVERVFEELNKAKRPVVLAGTGIVTGGARGAFLDLMKRLRVPVVGEAQNPDVLGNENEWFYGLSGNAGPRTGNYVIQNADVIVVLADSLNFRQTGFCPESFAPNARIVMVDADRNEMLKLDKPPAIFVECDIKEFLKIANQKKLEASCSAEWKGHCDMIRETFDPYEGAAGAKPEERVSQYVFWKAFNDIAADDIVVALGNNTAICAKMQVGKRTDEQRVVANNAFGSMGYDLPAAIGACVASGRETVCATGDGSVMMNLQELQTIAHYQLPIKVVVFLNEGYGTIRLTSDNYFDGLYFGCSEETGLSFPDFKKVAEAFGLPFYEISNNSEVQGVLKGFLKASGPAMLTVCERLVDPLIPKLGGSKRPDGTLAAPRFEELAPFIDEDVARAMMPDWS